MSALDVKKHGGLDRSWRLSCRALLWLFLLERGECLGDSVGALDGQRSLAGAPSLDRARRDIEGRADSGGSTTKLADDNLDYGPLSLWRAEVDALQPHDPSPIRHQANDTAQSFGGQWDRPRRQRPGAVDVAHKISDRLQSHILAKDQSLDAGDDGGRIFLSEDLFGGPERQPFGGHDYRDILAAAAVASDGVVDFVSDFHFLWGLGLFGGGGIAIATEESVDVALGGFHGCHGTPWIDGDLGAGLGTLLAKRAEIEGSNGGVFGNAGGGQRGGKLGDVGKGQFVGILCRGEFSGDPFASVVNEADIEALQ